MTHLTILIEIPVDCKQENLLQEEAEYAAKEAYKAARKSLPYFTAYNEDDFTVTITK